MKKVSIQLEELTCPSCIKKIETAIGNINGIIEVNVLFNSSKVKATFNEQLVNEDKIRNTISNLGYKVIN